MPANNGKPNNKRKRRPTGNQRGAARQVQREVERLAAPLAQASVPPQDAGDDRYAPTAWSSNLMELPLPSGQLCLVKQLDVAELAAEGLLDDYDRLTSMVQTHHVNKKMRSGGPPPREISEMEAAKQILKDPEKLQDIIKAMNSIVKMVVVKPELHDPPEEGEEREPGLAYIDYVSDDDKGFVMQWAFGGSTDLERFRAEVEQLGDGVPVSKDVEAPAE